jgi:hypothetical protein
MRYALAALALIWGCARAGRNGVVTDSSGSGSGDGGSNMIDARMIDAMIDGNGCATQPCDIPTQCGCGATQACDINFMTFMGTACRAVTTPGMTGNTCAAGTDCARGFVCVGDGTNDDCEKYCSTNADCTAPRGQCVIQLTD